MTFEEMQKIIEDMLSVQRELQESLLQVKERHVKFKERQAEFDVIPAIFENRHLEFEERQLQLLKSQEHQKFVLKELMPNYGCLSDHSLKQREIIDCLITIQNSKFKRTADY
ncbi:MAG: hypothetical protein F6K41_05425 [Symploca sp. SIO3E6]|nr:hypothetical protein [Caldora sp. SIO3E6]